MLEDLASWVTPALLVGLFAWLRADIRRTEDRLRAEMGDLRSEARATEGRLRSEMNDMRSEMRATEDRLRSEMNDMRAEIRGQIEGLDERLREVETGFAEVRGQLSFIQDYILRRNAPPDEPPLAPAE